MSAIDFPPFSGTMDGRSVIAFRSREIEGCQLALKNQRHLSLKVTEFLANSRHWCLQLSQVETFIGISFDLAIHCNSNQ